MSGSMYFNSPYIFQEKTGYLFLFYSQPGILLHLCLDYLVYIGTKVNARPLSFVYYFALCVSAILSDFVFDSDRTFEATFQHINWYQPSKYVQGVPCNRSLDQQIVSDIHVTDSS